MTHKANTFVISWKYFLFSFVAAAMCFLLLHVVAAFLLSKLACFEKYYDLCSWICFLLLSFLFAVPQRHGGDYSIIRTLIPSVTFSAMLISVSLIIGNSEATVLTLMIKCVSMCVVATLLLFALSRMRRDRKRKNLKFRRLK